MPEQKGTVRAFEVAEIAGVGLRSVILFEQVPTVIINHLHRIQTLHLGSQEGAIGQPR
jgi:hypothetical protein